jgi:3-phosphoshikimate 1-carboxyvinyltransferase
LILAALARGESQLLSPLDCDDSFHLRQALRALGTEIEEHPGRWIVKGGDLRPCEAAIWCGDAGTTLRFLAPLSLLLGGSELTLNGSTRLRERPLGPLLDALHELGAEIQQLEGGETLPVRIRGPRQPGSRATVNATHSSQFASALLMVGPCLPAGLTLELGGPPSGEPSVSVSAPYLTLTLATMARFGTSVRRRPGSFEVPTGSYRACELEVEGDWSAAALLLCGGWISGASLDLVGLDPASDQGDQEIIDFLEELDRPLPHRFDLKQCPDLIAPLAAAAICSSHPVEITNVAHARLKESDRVAVLARGLRSAGADVEELPDGLLIRPQGPDGLRPATLDPRGDHRMAMAFGLLSLLQPGIQIRDPDCVRKSYPAFWEDLERIREHLRSRDRVG